MVDNAHVSWRQAQFKIAKQTARTGHFASIVLQARPAVTDSISFAPEVPRTGWWPPIELGVTAALDALKNRIGLGPTEVLITGFVYLPTDTTDETAKTAAFMATLSAFLAPSQLPSLHLSEDQQRWRFEWPM